MSLNTSHITFKNSVDYFFNSSEKTKNNFECLKIFINIFNNMEESVNYKKEAVIVEVLETTVSCFLNEKFNEDQKDLFVYFLRKNFIEIKDLILEVKKKCNDMRIKHCVLLYAAMAKIESENFDLFDACGSKEHLNECVDYIVKKFKEHQKLSHSDSINNFEFLDLLKKIDFFNSDALSKLDHYTLSKFLFYISPHCKMINLSNCQIHNDYVSENDQENNLKRNRDYVYEMPLSLKKRKLENSGKLLSLRKENDSLMTLLPSTMKNLLLYEVPNLSKDDLESLSNSCPYLTNLSISQVVNLSEKEWLFLEKFSNLTLLRLNNCSDISDEVIARLLKNCPYLKHIDLSGSDTHLSKEILLRIAVINNDHEKVKKHISEGADLSDSLTETALIKEICKGCSTPIWINDNSDFLMALATKRRLPMDLDEPGLLIANIFQSSHFELCKIVCKNYSISFESLEILQNLEKGAIQDVEFLKQLFSYSEELISCIDWLKKRKRDQKIRRIYDDAFLSEIERNDCVMGMDIYFHSEKYTQITELFYNHMSEKFIDNVVKFGVNLLLDKSITKLVNCEFPDFTFNGGFTQVTILHLSKAIKKIADDLSPEDELSLYEVAVKEIFNDIFIGLGIVGKWKREFSASIPDTFFLQYIAKQIIQLVEDKNVNFPIWIPTGIDEHAIVICLHNKKDLIITNTGDGLEHHFRDGITNRYETSYVIENIPLEILRDISFWEELLKANFSKKIVTLYEYLENFAKKLDLSTVDFKPINKKLKRQQVRGSCSVLPYLHQIGYFINQLEFSKEVRDGLSKFFNALIKKTLGMEILEKLNSEDLLDVNEEREKQEVIQPLMIEAVKKQQGLITLGNIAKDEELLKKTVKKFNSFSNMDENKGLNFNTMTWPKKFNHLYMLAKNLGKQGSQNPDKFKHFLFNNQENKDILLYSKCVFSDTVKVKSVITDFLNKHFNKGEWSSIAKIITDADGELNQYLDFIVDWVCVTFKKNDSRAEELFDFVDDELGLKSTFLKKNILNNLEKAFQSRNRSDLFELLKLQIENSALIE